MKCFGEKISPRYRRHGGMVGLLLSIGLLLSVGVHAAEREPKTGEMASRPNVVIFLIDTLRADRLGAYGYDKPTSPNIDALSAQSVRFSRADSAAPWTLPSIVSMMTSTFPVEHGVVTDGTRVKPDEVVLAEALQDIGYSTTSFYANQYAGEASGMARGFDQAELVLYSGGDRIQNYAEQLDRDRPYFLYIHNVEPHNPFELRVSETYVEHFGEVSYSNRLRMLDLYEDYRVSTRVSDKDDSALQAQLLKELYALKEGTIDILYDASVRLADKMVGEVIGELKRAGLWENTFFLLVSDHGEEMGEHSGWQHDQSLYPELVHVPFILRFPENRFAGQIIDDPVTLVDVMPTLLDCLGKLEEGHSFDGNSLLPLIEAQDGRKVGEKGAIRFTAQRVNLKKHYRPFKEGRGDVNVAMHRGPWKAIWNVEHDTVELYDVGVDPQNTTDLAGTQPALVEEFRSAAKQRFGKLTLEQFQGKGGTWELSPEQIENLKTLGYLE